MSPLNHCFDIGQYLLTTFFDNDVKKVEDRAPRKGVSLRKIADHEDMMLTYMSLSNAVRLAAQEPLFIDPKYKDLTETHKILLFKLPDDKTKTEFAEKVVLNNLSVRKLRNLLAEKSYIRLQGTPN